MCISQAVIIEITSENKCITVLTFQMKLYENRSLMQNTYIIIITANMSFLLLPSQTGTF